MRARSLWKLAVPLCLFADPATAEVTIDNLLESIRGIDSASVSSDDCIDQLKRSVDMNGAQLFYGAAVCSHAGQEADGTFLLLAGQIRSVADMNSFEPDGQEDKEAMAELWGMIFYQLGGAGAVSLYRDVSSRDALFARLEAWSPTLPPSYDPGWGYKGPSDLIGYGRAIAEEKSRRKEQLLRYSTLISDPGYYAARTELSEIQRRNPRGIIGGTDDYRRMEQLKKIMEDVEAKLLP